VISERAQLLRPLRNARATFERLFREELFMLQPTRLVAEVLSSALPHLSWGYLRTLLWRAAGLRIGPRGRIMGRLHITGGGPWKDYLTIGSDCFLTGPLKLDMQAPITIGARVSIGQGVSLLTVDHEIGGTSRRCGTRFAQPITIGDGAWLCSGCMILPGVSVGKGSVVAAGAVVTADVPPDTLVAGVPARVVRRFSQDEAPRDEAPRDDAPVSGRIETEAYSKLSSALGAAASSRSGGV
jgi:maltose O-acetyltransferase